MMPILEDFGLIDEVSRGVRPQDRRHLRRGKSEELGRAFRSNPFLPYPYAYHVDREVFDGIMLDNAGETGVHILQGVTVRPPSRWGPRHGRAAIDTDGEERDVHCRYVVDAAGRGPSSAGEHHERTTTPRCGRSPTTATTRA